MDAFWRLMETTDTAGGVPTVETALLSLLMAFVLGQPLAWVYRWTHSGLSYSRSFTQSLVLLTVVVALVMVVIGNNIATAFGLIGALTIIRFRNVLKDTRDTVFVFVALVLGMAVGSERYGAAIVGALVLLAVIAYIHWTDFGSQGHFDGYLRFNMPLGDSGTAAAAAVMRQHCRATRQLSFQQIVATHMAQCTYQVLLYDPAHGENLVGDLQSLAGVEDVSLVLQDEAVEV